MTAKEKLMMEHPEHVGEQFTGGCAGCPDCYGLVEPTYCEDSTIPVSQRCTMCWDREIPEHDTVDDCDQCCIPEFKHVEENFMISNNKKTKAQLIAEIEAKEFELKAAKAEMEKFEKYRKYDEMGDELFAMKSALVNSGFNNDEAFSVLINLIKASGRML